MENFGRKSIFSSAACTAAVTTDASDVLRAQLTRDLSFLLVVSPGMTCKTGQMYVLVSVQYQHFQNPKAPRPLGQGR